MTTVGEIMTSEVKTLRKDQTLYEAMVYMREIKARHLPVLDAEEKLVGLVTDRDIKRATPSVLLDNRDAFEKTIRETTVERIMTRSLITIGSGSSFKEAVNSFAEEPIGCLPVVDDGKLVGIVTGTDMFRAMQGLLT
jgi:acetoin utilization protein AcuB